jgi:hypothetical protein
LEHVFYFFGIAIGAAESRKNPGEPGKSAETCRQRVTATQNMPVVSPIMAEEIAGIARNLSESVLDKYSR